MTRVALGLLVLGTLVRTAAADCVVLDESRDTLAPEDRRAAQISMAAAFQKAGVAVSADACAQTFTFYNVKLGSTISVYVVGPGGNREGRAAKLDDLPMVYEQLAHSLVSGQPMGSVDNVDRTNATLDQMAPRRVEADRMWYVRLGYGAVTGHVTDSGTALGFGYRYELDQIAVDLAMNFVWASDSVTDSMGITHSEGGVSGELIGIGVVNYQEPLANKSLYYGARFGYGFNSFYDASATTSYSGSGLELTGVVGYEMLRASTIRLFVEFDAMAPLYRSNGTVYDANFNQTGTVSHWAPVMSLTLGAGLGHSNTIAVVNR